MRRPLSDRLEALKAFLRERTAGTQLADFVDDFVRFVASLSSIVNSLPESLYDRIYRRHLSFVLDMRRRQEADAAKVNAFLGYLAYRGLMSITSSVKTGLVSSVEPVQGWVNFYRYVNDVLTAREIVRLAESYDKR